MGRWKLWGRQTAGEDAVRRPENDDETVRPQGAASGGLENTRASTSLPSGVFRACAPTVERQLSDSVGDVFLEAMSVQRPPQSDEKPADVKRPGDSVTDAERSALATEVTGWDPVVAPDLASDLIEERLWVLADLIRVSTGIARQRAAGALRVEIDTQARAHALDPTIADAILASVREHGLDDELSMLTHMLALAAKEAHRSAARLPSTES